MSEGPFGRRSEPVDESPAPPSSEEAPFRQPAPPTPPRGISSITWILGVLVVLALAYITLNSLRTDGPGSRGVTVGSVLPPFAAPLARSGIEGDAQVDPKKACGVSGPDVLNSCKLAKSNEPVVLAFLATRSKQCETQVDRVDRVARRVSGVQFAAVGIRGSKADLASASERWRIPVAHDRDGAVSNLFAVAVCPTITFARAGGVVEHTTLGLVEEAEIERRIEALRVTSEGWIDATVASEFPELRLHHVALPVAGPLGRSGPGIRERLREMSDRFTGAQAIAMRTQPIHHAQRVFFRHIGLDPDRDRPPAEAMAVERLRAGAFKSDGRLRDAITIAVMETGVPVWALDGEAVSTDLGVRPAASGEDVAGVLLSPGKLVVADAAKPVAVLYGDLGVPVVKTTRLVRLFSVQVAGVPSIHVEEALWTVAEIFDEDDADS